MSAFKQIILSVLLFVALTMIAACGKEESDKYFTTQNLYTEAAKEEVETPASLIITDGNSFLAPGYPAALIEAGWSVKDVRAETASDETLVKTAVETVDPLIPVIEPEVKTETETAETTEAETVETEEKETAPAALVVYWEGFNSFKAGSTAADAYASLTQYVSDRQKAGFKVLVVTMVYSTDAAMIQAGFFTFLQAYNALVLDNEAGADYVLDLMIDPRLSDAGNRTYFEADKTRLGKHGVKALAQDVANLLRDEGFVKEGVK